MAGLYRRHPTAAPAASGPESLTLPAATNTDFHDSPVNVGTLFAVTTPGTWVGNRIRITDTNPAFVTAFAARFDLATIVEQQAFVSVPGGYQDVLFAVPIPVVAGPSYAAGYFTDRYAFSNAVAWPLSSSSGRIVTPAANGGCFQYAAVVACPDVAAALCFLVSPLVTFP